MRTSFLFLLLFVTTVMAETKEMSVMDSLRLSYRIEKKKTNKGLEFTFEIQNNEKVTKSPGVEVFLMTDLKTFIDEKSTVMKDLKPGETRIVSITFPRHWNAEPYYVARLRVEYEGNHVFAVKASTPDFESFGKDNKTLATIFSPWSKERFRSKR